MALPPADDQSLPLSGSPFKIEGPQSLSDRMELFRILESVIFHHRRTLRSYPLKENSFPFDPEFFDDRFEIDGMDVKHGEWLGRADPYMENFSPVQVL